MTLCKVVNNLSTSKISDVINKLPVVNILSSYFVNWWIDIAADQKTDYLMLGPTALLRKMAKNRDSLVSIMFRRKLVSISISIHFDQFLINKNYILLLEMDSHWNWTNG